MIRYVNLLVVTAIALLTVTSCSTTKDEKKKVETKPNVVAKANVEGEAYLEYLDFNDSLYKTNSLHYSRSVNDKMEWAQVIMSIDDSNTLLKMVEQYSPLGSNTVFSNHFYFKDGYRYATKQFFAESIGDSSYFVELLSYYDKNENVLATKRRTAHYEDLLTQEPYMVTDNKDCSPERAFRIVNQEGEFATTFQGFIEGPQGFRYLVVGEDKKDGFSTALVVQRSSPLLMELRSNEKNMLGLPLVINFETITDAGGAQQILLGVAKKAS